MSASNLSEQAKAIYEERIRLWEESKQALYQHYREQRAAGIPVDEEYFSEAELAIPPRNPMVPEIRVQKPDYMPRARRYSFRGDLQYGDPPAGNSYPGLTSPPGFDIQPVDPPVRPDMQQMGRGRGQHNHDISRSLGRGMGTDQPPQQPPAPSIARFQQQQKKGQQQRQGQLSSMAQLHQQQKKEQKQQGQGQEEQPLQNRRISQKKKWSDSLRKENFGLPRSFSLGNPSVTPVQTNQIRTLHEMELRELGQIDERWYSSISPQKPSAIPRPATVHPTSQDVRLDQAETNGQIRANTAMPAHHDFRQYHRPSSGIRAEPNEQIQAITAMPAQYSSPQYHRPSSGIGAEPNEKIQATTGMPAQYDSRQYHYPSSGIPQRQYSMYPGSMAPPPVPTTAYAQNHVHSRPKPLGYHLQEGNERPQPTQLFGGYQGHGEYPASGYYSDNQQNTANYPGMSRIPHAHTFNAGQAGSYPQAGAFARQLQQNDYSSHAVPTRIPQPMSFGPLQGEYSRYPQFAPGSLAIPQGINPYNQAADYYDRHQVLKPSYSFSHGQAPRPPPEVTTILEDGKPKVVKNIYRPLKPINPQIALVTESMAPGYWSGRFSSSMDRMNELNPLLPDNSKKFKVMEILSDCCKSQDATNSYWAWRRLQDMCENIPRRDYQ
ncbi:hypothetical protein BZA05DRAFT_440010 [Tricharina praecox]|uniref:uncharacterized protein n=1 Tax=Tricharina praecox TaxID=43433 RepID=UPI00221E9758|nr:uncharacterized protein BZA05DRAFT_440010 [Tricharina praecox]KAI5858346.1 hypothetical protein BZA05DRAFT_440010 [Tricharina praecox]